MRTYFARTRRAPESVTRRGILVMIRRPTQSAPLFFVAIRKALVIAAQTAALWLTNLGASAAVAWLHAPVPGNVLGLTLLFILLCSGIVKASWLEPGATVLVRHLAFFFIPITVGLVDMGPLFALHGVGIVFTLALSAAVGMAASGLTYQRLACVQAMYETRLRSEPKA